METGQYDQARLTIFLTIFAVMCLLEVLKPRKKLTKSKPKRWISNFLLTFLSGASARYFLPFTGISAAVFAKEKGIGLFNDIYVNPVLTTVFVVLVFDLVIYWQHQLFHKVPVLWRLHKVHHSDQDYDVTTGSRFHPIEIVLSMVIKIFLILALGAPVFAVFLFEAILNGMAMFNHSNVKLPASLDTLLRKVFVTPDFHRVHHSTLPKEHHRNFGFNLSIWDYLFGSYTPQPSEGHEEMKIGLNYISDEKKTVSLYGMLLTPFVSDDK